MSKHTFYAVHQEGAGLSFTCVAKDRGQLEQKINLAFWAWGSCQPKGSNPKRADFMKDKSVVKVTVQTLKDSGKELP